MEGCLSIIDEHRPEGPAGGQSSGRTPDDDPVQEHDPTGAEPIFNVPPMVLGLLAIMIGVMLWRLALDPEADTIFVLMLALIPARLAGLASELPGGAAAVYTQFVTHMFVHADAMHLAFNGASLLAFAGALEKRVGAFRLLLFFLVCGLAGAVTFIAVNPGLLAPMIGASGAIAGLMGGVMRFFFSALDRGGLWRLTHAPRSVPLMPLSAALQDRRMLAVTASFIIMNIAAMVGFGDLNANNAIAWEAHVGGYLAGLFLFGLFDIAPHHEEFPRNEI
jgi:membrane associated rhomboid family serine protease